MEKNQGRKSFDFGGHGGDEKETRKTDTVERKQIVGLAHVNCLLY